MTKYISNPDNLKLMMNMLKEKSRNIQFEAFHVFKVSSSPAAAERAEIHLVRLRLVLCDSPTKGLNSYFHN